MGAFVRDRPAGPFSLSHLPRFVHLAVVFMLIPRRSGNLWAKKMNQSLRLQLRRIQLWTMLPTTRVRLRAPTRPDTAFSGRHVVSRGLVYSFPAADTDAHTLLQIEHVVFPAMRHMFTPPRRLADQGAILKVADLKDLYKASSWQQTRGGGGALPANSPLAHLRSRIPLFPRCLSGVKSLAERN